MKRSFQHTHFGFNVKKVLAAGIWSIMSMNAAAQRIVSLDKDWKFHRNAVINAEMADCDDTGWRTLTVPHDFSLEPAFIPTDGRQKTDVWKEVQIGPFVRNNMGDSDQGQMVGGEGWYRKTLRLPVSDGETLDTFLSKKAVNIVFDGVYNHAEVWVNGQKAAMNVHGYMPFMVRLNDVLKNKRHRLKDNENVVKIAVKALNVDHNSRWYTGSGIYRHVWLTVTDKLHLNEWDVFIDGSHVSANNDAAVKVSAKVINDDKTDASGMMTIEIIDHKDKVVASTKCPYHVKGDDQVVNTEVMVKKAHLWSDTDPYRYKARVSIDSNGEEHDAITIPFGIRTIEFTAKKGFKLNGKVVKMRGGCVHHDNGLLGTAAVDRAEVRKVELIKQQGFNAIRCSHNLPSVAFLNACDSIGLLVMDEVFDQWEKPKRKDDYSTFFSKEKQQIVDGEITGMGITNSEYDAAMMVRRDRNHPSIVIWSIGNEIYQRSDPRGKEIGTAISGVIKREDPTRPTTLANCTYWDIPGKTWEKDSPMAFETTDLAGYNYATQYYENDHKKFPERIIVGTEIYPSGAAQNWKFIESNPYVIGDFIWTAMDYLGEAGVGHTFERSNDSWVQVLGWPWFNSWCGDIDLIGNKKPQSYYRDVVWGYRPIAMAIRPAIPEGEHEEIRGWGWTAEEGHWNWDNYLPMELRPEMYQTSGLMNSVVHDIHAARGDSLRVNVYTKRQRVRLSINGKVVGEKDVNPDHYTAQFRVAYEPGQIKAEVIGKSSKKSAHAEVCYNTAAAPAAIRLHPLDSKVTSSHNDLAYIYINIVDEHGNLCPTAELPLKIETSGAKHIAVGGTGHPFDMKSFRSLTPTTFRGKALLIIQPQDERGKVNIKVSSNGIKSGEYTVDMQ